MSAGRVQVKQLIPFPFPSRAYIPTTPHNKLKDYVLNPDHPDGGPKAAWFGTQLGIFQDDWLFLHDQILERVHDARLETFGPIKWPYGIEFSSRISIRGRNDGIRSVRTCWLFEPSGRAKFTTVYP